jgi:hypothetical protein
MNSAIFSEINWLAFAVAAVAYFALGAIWYSVLFGKQWIALNKIDMSDPNAKKGVGGVFLASFIMMALTSLGIAILVARLAPPMEVMSGIKIGLIASLFAITTMCINYIYEKRPFGLYLIHGGYALVGLIAASIIIVMWR